jgi:hypothetical protein
VLSKRLFAFLFVEKVLSRLHVSENDVFSQRRGKGLSHAARHVHQSEGAHGGAASSD